MFFALVDIEHLTTILRFIDIKHLAAADGTPSEGIISITDPLHLKHVLTADTLVATLVEKNRGIITVVDNGITH